MEQSSFPNNLVTDVIESLLISLPLQDLLNLCNTNRRFNLYAQSDTLWNARFCNEFLFLDVVKTTNITWRQFYFQQISSNISVDIYLDKYYIKSYYIPHIMEDEHFNDYLEKIKKVVVNHFKFSSDYLILYDTIKYNPIAFSIPSVSTYLGDWTIDETILPPPITSIFIYTDPNSIRITGL